MQQAMLSVFCASSSVKSITINTNIQLHVVVINSNSNRRSLDLIKHVSFSERKPKSFRRKTLHLDCCSKGSFPGILEPRNFRKSLGFVPEKSSSRKIENWRNHVPIEILK